MGDSDTEVEVTPVMVVQDFLWNHGWDVHNGAYTVDSDDYYSQCGPIAQSLLSFLEEAGYELHEMSP
jgi:hypothetical protein